MKGFWASILMIGVPYTLLWHPIQGLVRDKSYNLLGTSWPLESASMISQLSTNDHGIDTPLPYYGGGALEIHEP